ncbi:Putative NTF2-like domain superfamily protein [Septoria linicola]|uniref:NTF2-like domain superfamily protein n=1 Tax=Septoria linicola TaxID=215465 RepID=A0A9Q9AQN1_9PEZI|nr:putative NTF2-like domain superfamily protein [Septoria linicola]USW52704.1 Putative NTF2-like domain superfamily protein [Septoria linicola]
MSQSTLTNMKRVVQATLDGLNAWDLETIVAVRSQDFHFQVLPTSLGQTPKNMKEYRELWDTLLTPTFQQFKITPLNEIYDVGQKKATVYTTIEIVTAVGPFNYEMIQIYTLSGDGEKLTRLEEFFDSKVYLEVAATFGGGPQAK